MAREGRLAKNIPTGLEFKDPKSTKMRGNLTVIEGRRGTQPLDPLDRREFGKPVRQHLREFGAVLALVMTIIGAFQMRHDGGVGMLFSLVVTGLLVYAVGVFLPRLLLKPWESWMLVAHGMGFVMTTIILTATWVLLMVPLGAGLRVLGIKVMDSNFRLPVQTYWDDRDPKLSDFKLLERQY